MHANEQAYLLRRVLQEQQAALNASCPEARERHEELASAYQLRRRLAREAVGMKSSKMPAGGLSVAGQRDVQSMHRQG